MLIPVFVGFTVAYSRGLAAGAENAALRYAALATYVLAAASDGLDGYLARRYHQESRLGSILDPIADKLLLMAAVVTLAFAQWTNPLPFWFAALVIGRDIVILLGVAIIYLAAGSVKMGPHWTSKVCTLLQMSCVAWVLFDIRPWPIVLFVLIWSAAAFTVVSGLYYLIEGVRQLRAQGAAIGADSSDQTHA